MMSFVVSKVESLVSTGQTVNIANCDVLLTVHINIYIYIYIYILVINELDAQNFFVLQ